MKRLRSKLPCRKRSHCSPILKLINNPTSITNSSSNLTLEPSLACDSSSRLSTNKRSFTSSFNITDGNDVVSEFRRITRSYSKRMEAIKTAAAETTSLKNIINIDNIKGSTVSEFECSEGTNRSDVVSVTSRRKFATINEVVGLEAQSEFKSGEITSCVNNSNSKTQSDVVSVTSRVKFGLDSDLKLLDAAVNESVGLEAESECSKPKDYAESGEVTSYVSNSVTNELEAETCGESKPIADDFNLTCSEHLSGDYEECEFEYSSVECTDVNMESSEVEVEVSSEFDTSSWYDSGSQLSERSFGDVNPSPTFQLFMNYRQLFCKSEFDVKVSAQYDDNQPSNGVVKLLSPEDEEHEESYQMLKKRERRQVYLHNYTEEYRMMKEYGDLVVQQRSKMVHWIMKQSASKELQKETLFLGVSLLDRFLRKGYFRNKRELEIAGIACLTLATRIEENQPYNSIRQKSFNVGGNEYRRSEVVAMEWLVQEVLNFQCYLPTIYNFLWFYLKAARANQHVANTAKYLALQALFGHEQLCYWPSTVAASLVCLACLTENKQSSHQHITRIRNGLNDKDLSDCIKSMECLAQSIH
ncbi:cyclin-SDS-like [Bidens hawaiensis]|uniref:cyclin-SDS-like n=1 Tax=Bidens hawaiensis TaxID=980011 RepID=UPI0040498F56